MSTATLTPPPTDTNAEAPREEVDIAIVGSGFSGLAMAYRLRRDGIEDFVVLEKANSDLAGHLRTLYAQ